MEYNFCSAIVVLFSLVGAVRIRTRRISCFVFTWSHFRHSPPNPLLTPPLSLRFNPLPSPASAIPHAHAHAHAHTETRARTRITSISPYTINPPPVPDPFSAAGRAPVVRAHTAAADPVVVPAARPSVAGPWRGSKGGRLRRRPVVVVWCGVVCVESGVIGWRKRGDGRVWKKECCVCVLCCVLCCMCVCGISPSSSRIKVICHMVERARLGALSK
jgi:hypothetical protein